MQFILIAYDGTDKDALKRRMKVREQHLKGAKDLRETGNLIWGGAILDEEQNMTGSVIVYDYDSREELDRMLESEPYIKGDVWKDIDIRPFRLATF
jgi:uncharacterized protein